MKHIQPPRIETEIKAGERIEIEGRSIYPVVEISVLKTHEGSALGSWIAPVAILVIEQDEQYAISFTNEEITADRIGKMVPSLKKVIDKARGIYRIEVS
jgi:hypothetical protein